MNDSTRPGRPKVALFVTCMVDALYPQVGMAAVDLLERHGAQVVFPTDQTCCGQPAFNAGHPVDARTMARHFIDVFWPLVHGGDVDAIVAPSGSCVAMVRHGYTLLFEQGNEDRGRAADLSRVTYELSEYLVDILDVDCSETSVAGTITYHPCCHLLRDLHVDRQPRQLLETIGGAQFVDLPGAEECCGFGGLFAIKHAPISTAMGRQKVRNLQTSGADLVVMNDAGCMAHVNGILERDGHTCRAVHIAELLNQQTPLRENSTDSSGTGHAATRSAADGGQHRNGLLST